MNPNARLTLLRVLAVLVVLPGAGLIVWAMAIGVQRGGYAWLLAAAFVFLGVLFVAIPVRFFKKPTQSVAADILTVCSLIGFGALLNGLRTVSPDTWGLPKKMGIAGENAESVRALIALLVVWALHRVLRKHLVADAFVTPPLVHTEKA